MSPSKQSCLAQIPSVEILLADAQTQGWTVGVPRRTLVDCVRAAVEQMRTGLLESADGAASARKGDSPHLPERPDGCFAQMGTVPFSGIDRETLHRTILADARRRAENAVRPHYRKVINATGIILHTALGRAVLPAKAMRQIEAELSGYSLLQADIATGERSRRDGRIEEVLKQLTGTEAATVVNNNAAATAIVLNTVACGKEVIVSRGQLVEIGGSFRLPDVMAASGAKLVEVGTTNKTHARDYENAITSNTAAILRVHPSNYKISGFTAEVPLPELVRIGRAHGLVVIDDLGAGPLLDFSRFGFDKEPTLQESVQAGADLITASADKLIGAGQGGIILGRASLIQAVRKNPLARIVRVGKLTLAALEATLTLFLDEDQALREVPTLRMLCRSLADITAQANRIAEAIDRQTPGAFVTTAAGFSQMGSGSLPTQNLRTRLVAIKPESVEAGELAARLRLAAPPVFARVHKGQVLLDPRTLLEGEETVLIEACIQALRQRV